MEKVWGKRWWRFIWGDEQVMSIIQAITIFNKICEVPRIAKPIQCSKSPQNRGKKVARMV